jgi:hypothetical protein
MDNRVSSRASVSGRAVEMLASRRQRSSCPNEDLAQRLEVDREPLPRGPPVRFLERLSRGSVQVMVRGFGRSFRERNLLHQTSIGLRV